MIAVDNETITKQLQFLAELDRLKSVLRQSPLADRSRRENSAEHSWHLAMFAMVLSDHADDDVDMHLAIKMLLVHDIVEIDAGDMPVHSSDVDWDALAKAEAEAAERIFGLLPDQQASEIKALWTEFEAAETPTARFAKAIDRMQPLLLNILTGGGTWTDDNLDEQHVVDFYGPIISGGSNALWDATRQMVQAHFAQQRD